VPSLDTLAWQRVWREAVSGVTRGRSGRRGAHEVTTFHPSGTIAMIFVAPRDAEREAHLAWRRLVNAASRDATWTSARLTAQVQYPAVARSRWLGLMTKLHLWGMVLALGASACGTVAGGVDSGSSEDGGNGPDSNGMPPPAIESPWPDPVGAHVAGGDLPTMTLENTGNAETIYECRTGPAGTFTSTVPAWGPCDGGSGMNPTHHPTFPTGIDDGGSYRTEYRYRLPSRDYTSPVVAYDYYVHNSLDGISPCPVLPNTDEEYFTFAKAFDPTNFATGSTFDVNRVTLRNPIIRILFLGVSASESARYSSMYDGLGSGVVASASPFDFTGGTLSLRHKYVMSADHTMILMRRFYPSRTGSCRQELQIGAPQGVNYVHDVTCDAFVVNSPGKGLCLASAPVRAVAIDQNLAYNAGTDQAGTLNGAPGSTIVNGAGTAFTSGWVNCYLKSVYGWQKIASVTSATQLRLAVAARWGLNGTPRLYCGPVADTFITPSGYTKIRQDNRPRGGGSGQTYNKCTSDPTCNDTDPSHIDYLPP